MLQQLALNSTSVTTIFFFNMKKLPYFVLCWVLFQSLTSFFTSWWGYNLILALSTNEDRCAKDPPIPCARSICVDSLTPQCGHPDYQIAEKDDSADEPKLLWFLEIISITPVLNVSKFSFVSVQWRARNVSFSTYKLRSTRTHHSSKQLKGKLKLQT